MTDQPEPTVTAPEFIRGQALRDAAAWLESIGETDAAYLLRTCDVPSA